MTLPKGYLPIDTTPVKTQSGNERCIHKRKTDTQLTRFVVQGLWVLLTLLTLSENFESS